MMKTSEDAGGRMAIIRLTLRWAKKLFIPRLRHEEVKDAECGRRNRRQEEKARVGTKVMHNGTGDRLAERSAHADGRTDGPEREIKAARAFRKVGDHQNETTPKIPAPTPSRIWIETSAPVFSVSV